MSAGAAPDGFVLLEDWGGPFMAYNGPIHQRVDEDGLTLGFHALPRHGNQISVHGGWIAGFMDLVLPLCAMHQVGLRHYSMLTISMTVDYLGPAPLGAWVEGRGRALRRTRKLLFCDAIVSAGGEPVARGSGVWKIGQPIAG